MPNKALIHWVIIKEPNKHTNSKGRIYVLSESVEESDYNFLAKFFGYKKEKVEPRLYGLKYSRKLHEQIEKGLMGKLKSGRPVPGKFTKITGDGQGKEKGESGDNDGGGSESQEQEWEFHELLPSEIHKKPTR